MSNLILLTAALLTAVSYLAYRTWQEVRSRRLDRFRQGAREMMMTMRRLAVSPIAARRLLAVQMIDRIWSLLTSRGLAWQDIGTSQGAIDQWLAKAKQNPEQDEAARRRMLSCLQDGLQPAATPVVPQPPEVTFEARPEPASDGPDETDILIEDADGPDDDLDILIVTGDEADEVPATTAVVTGLDELPPDYSDIVILVDDETDEHPTNRQADSSPEAEWNEGLKAINTAIDEVLSREPPAPKAPKPDFGLAPHEVLFTPPPEPAGPEQTLDIDFAWRRRYGGN